MPTPMPTSPALLVLRGLRADAIALTGALTAGDDFSRRQALMCAAGAELTELTVAHVRSGRRHALAALPPDAAVRAAAQLHDLQLAADAAGDAVALLGSAGLSGGARGDARRALVRSVATLAAALPSDTERRAAAWDAAALHCAAPSWLVLGSALRGADEVEVPDAWRLPWQQVRDELHRSALHRALTADFAAATPGRP
jgi:hypothetical protein